MRYETRNHAFAPATTWVLEGARVRLEDGKGPPQDLALSDVVSVRAEFAPTRVERNRFRCRVTWRGGKTREFFNRRFVALATFADTSEAYAAWVRALVAAAAQHAPRCEFHAGATRLSYGLNLLAMVFIGVCFAAIAWFLSRVNLTWMVAVKIVFLLFYMPTLLQWGARNRPRRFRPTEIPDDVLPAAPALRAVPAGDATKRAKR